MRWMLAIVVLAAGCGSSTNTAGSSTTERCVVHLHGKGSAGQATIVSNGTTELSPTGNADGWGARQWLYFPDGSYVQARRVVADALDGTACNRVVIDGFSNGASFAAKLYCSGETFDGRVVGVVVDDPVPDASASNCRPRPDVDVVLYWTTALAAQASPGADCATLDWTCEGGTTIGIAAYAADLGASITPSPFAQHTWYRDAPEIASWLNR